MYLLGRNNGEKQLDKASANARHERLFDQRAFWFGELAYLRDPRGRSGEQRQLSCETSGAFKAGQSFDWTISPVSKFTQRLNGLFKADDFGDSLYHLDAGLATTVASRLKLKVSYIYDYKNQPPSPEIEKGDSALFAALLVKF